MLVFSLLNKPMKMKKYGTLPKPDVLDTLVNKRRQQDVTCTAVGYGLQESPNAAAGLNGNCAGTGGVYSVDRADDLNWLYSEFGEHLL